MSWYQNKIENKKKIAESLDIDFIEFYIDAQVKNIFTFLQK